MPYPGVPKDKTEKMDRCVQRVVKTGRSKDSAIAICHDSVMGKKEISESEWSTMSDEGVESVIEGVLDDFDKSKERVNKKGYVPFGITSFSDLDNYRKARDQANAVYSLTDDFMELVGGVMVDENITDKAASVVSLANEFAGRLKKPPEVKEKEVNDGLMNRIVSAVSEAFGLKPKEKNDTDTAMMVWKEEDGTYRWLARYSNNFRDDDNPPEIISEKSHRRFVDMVDNKECDPPELWLWHRPEWKVGHATSVAYDDSGFAVATGYFDKGKEYIAEWLSKQSNVAVSHAMPRDSIVYDTEDPSVIVEHRTVEISPLPLWAAANKLTGFVVVQEAQKEADMAIPNRKRESFIKEWGISPDLLDKLEGQNAVDAEKALEDGRESKEQSEPVDEQETVEKDGDEAPVVEQTEQDQTEEPDGEPQEQEQKDPVLEQPPTRQEIADAFGSIFSEMKEALSMMADRIGSIENEVKELKESDQEKIEKATNEIPTASLSALLAHRMIGRPETAVDGRSSLAKSKPKEVDEVSPRYGIPFIDRMVEDQEQ